MKRFVLIEFLALLIIPLTYTLTLADTVVLKDGQVLQGIFTDGSNTSINMEVEGTIQEINISEITSLTFHRGRPQLSNRSPMQQQRLR